MDNKKDILTDVFRERLKDYKHPVPDNNLWDKINKDLTKSFPPTHRKITMRTKFMLAAASIALLIGVSLFLTKNDSSENNIAESESHTPLKGSVNPKPKENILTISGNKNEFIQVTETSNKEEQMSKQFIHSGKTIPINPNIIQNIPDTANGKKSNPDDNEKLVAKQKEEKESDMPEPRIKQENQQKQTLPEDQYRLPVKKQLNKSNLSLALAFGNSGLSSQGSSNIGYYTQSIPVNQYISSEHPKNNIKKSKDINYKIPLSIGVSFRKHLTNKWALESGLVYTYLSSTEKQEMPEMNTIQTDIALNYIGVPIKGTYSFYNTKNTSIYASAGGMVEKCVYGKQTISGNNSETLDTPELQWSISGNVGVNYKLHDHLGIFLEPGLGYYFNDGSEIETIRKDSPLKFNIQAGLRLTY